MIKLSIETNGKDIADAFEEYKPTLQECAFIIYRMKEIEKYLLEKEFESKFEVKEGCFAEDQE
jgi:hypothetical protein